MRSSAMPLPNSASRGSPGWTNARDALKPMTRASGTRAHCSSRTIRRPGHHQNGDRREQLGASNMRPLMKSPPTYVT